MVDASELAWRMLSRRYGAELCYTPMLHSQVFVRDARYRRDSLQTCPEDRPLIVQFCANDPAIFAKACELAAPFCDAVDLNLGCPQTIAKRGRYGAFLMHEWPLIAQMIKAASTEVDIPITAKIRVFPKVEDTIAYARMLQEAGVSILTVHGRTRDQKGPITGLADWAQIKAVREAVNIPVFANGNIQYLPDVERCLEITGVQGVMTAEGNLHNPSIFTGKSPPVWETALEYLELVKKYPCPLSYSRGHIFRLLHHCFNLPENFELRFEMSKASTVEAMMEVTLKLRERFIDYHIQTKTWNPPAESACAKLPFPPWICQPYVRIPAEEHLRKVEESERRQKESGKRDNSEPQKLSRKKLKKLLKNPEKKFPERRVQDLAKCVCRNPRGNRCEYLLCRSCCKLKCHLESLECKGHRVSSRAAKESRPSLLSMQGSKLYDSRHENEEKSGDINSNNNNLEWEDRPDLRR